jgi:hypothetical protein
VRLTYGSARPGYRITRGAAADWLPVVGAGPTVRYEPLAANVVQSGGTVSQIRDTSGHGNDSQIQGDPGAQPIYHATGNVGATGKPTLGFDGARLFLSAALSLPQPLTVVLVASNGGNPAGGSLIDGDSGGARYYCATSDGLSLMDWTDSGTGLQSIVAASNPIRTGGSLAILSYNGTSSTYVIDGVSGTGTLAGSAPVALHALTVGTAYTGGAPFVGQMGLLLVYPFALTGGQVSTLSAAIRSHFGFS